MRLGVVVYCAVAFILSPVFTMSLAHAEANDNRAANLDSNDRSEGLRAIVDREARANGIPIALARAVVRIESNWNAGVTGRSGALGLMQIKHRTARGMGYQGSPAGLYDASTNAKWGMRYLAGAYKRAGGDTCGTVMRYQGGYGAKRMSPTARAYCGRARTLMAAAN